MKFLLVPFNWKSFVYFFAYWTEKNIVCILLYRLSFWVMGLDVFQLKMKIKLVCRTKFIYFIICNHHGFLILVSFEKRKFSLKVKFFWKIYEKYSLEFKGIYLSKIFFSGINLSKMWNTFSHRQESFIARYAAYHHFRSKGWVARFSNLFGADFGIKTRQLNIFVLI